MPRSGSACPPAALPAQGPHAARRRLRSRLPAVHPALQPPGRGVFGHLRRVRVRPAGHRPRRATAPGGLTGLGRTGAVVVGPWLGGAVVEGGDAGLGFTAFAVTGVLGAAAIRLVPIARRTRRGPAAQQAPAPSGAID
ncbi:hypothetical protein ACIO6T_21860 [Streptomyces sp. NPDC087532]|uniref:hypothetical protein n=1 Tax=Streptomyces sp. NPDC087532 TaxID=3365795 RepID=UPI0037F46440